MKSSSTLQPSSILEIKLKGPMAEIGEVYEREFSDGISSIKGYCVLLSPNIELCEINGVYYIDKVFSLNRVTQNDLEVYGLRKYFRIQKQKLGDQHEQSNV